MGGIKSFNEIFAFVAAQTCFLALLAALDGLLSIGAFPRPGNAAYLSGYFLIAAGVLAMLRLVWPVLIEPVELFWGTSAKVRVSKWLLPALLASSIVFAIASVVSLQPYQPALLDVVLIAVTAVGLAAPLAVTMLLLFSAWRRRSAISRGLEKMECARNGAAKDADLGRIDASIATEIGIGTTTVRASPQGFTFAGLSSKPWHDRADFNWLPAFVDATDKILAEAEAIMKSHDDRIEMYHYVGLDGDFWRSFKLATRHEEISANLALCPTTAALLRTIPGYPSFRDAMFSILGPGGVIKSHRDVSNVFLTLHLPLIAPGNGYIEVGGIRREWRKGEPLIFDSSYNHQAANFSDRTRVVLLVDFPHPDLTAAERAWVRAARL
jgi:beta-hydroxylase